MNNLNVPISVGELFDKISILEIKKEKITCKKKLDNVEKELNVLYEKKLSLELSEKKYKDDIQSSIFELKKINLLLWNIEDKIRKKETEKCFDSNFIELARAVYLNNDKRASIKKHINTVTNSDIIEEKSYNEL